MNFIDEDEGNLKLEKSCTITRPKWNLKSALIGVTVLIVLGAACYHIQQSLTRRNPDSLLRGLGHLGQFPDVNTLDYKVSYAIYKHEAKCSWKVEVCESKHVQYNNSICTFKIDYHGILFGQLNMQHTRIFCIKIHHSKNHGKAKEFCQKISDKLRIPVSLFFISAISGKQTIDIPRDKLEPSDTDNDANYLSLITLPEGTEYALGRYKLNIKETFSSGYLNGRLSWRLDGRNHRTFPWTYNKTSHTFMVHREGIYLVLLTLHSYIYTSNMETAKMQACLNNTCARLELFEGMAAPLTLIDMHRLQASDEFDVYFYNIPGLYRFSLLNKLTIFSFPITTQFQKYLLNEQQFYVRTSEHKLQSLQWKSTKNAEFEKRILLDNNTFVVQEKGNYLIILSLNLYTRKDVHVLQRDGKNTVSLVTCIQFSHEISRCQNYTLPLGVVLPVMLTHVKQLSSGESFHITMNQAALYRSAKHNSVIVVRL
ncbi:Hypothetical predicted protein [Mytilus galloprovincialis]|uniref:Uncharacterized protein n=1 Tax=Mytilus galloprovincialis TaxID=29158 RepID=A0A8B6D1Q7_MYTGA|nr:Hypothetical predicted protein [Mytilus galloprovincialis]